MFDWFLFFFVWAECSIGIWWVKCVWNARNLVRTSLVPFVYLPYRTIRHERENCTWKIWDLSLSSMSSFVPLSVCFFWFQQEILAYILPVIGTPVAVEWLGKLIGQKHSWSWEAMTLAHRLQRHQNKYSNSDITPGPFEMTFPLFNFVLYLPKVFFPSAITALTAICSAYFVLFA